MECERLGAMIRTCRMEKRLTQRQLADMLGVSDRTVSKWERCRGCPDISLLAGLSRILGADLEELLEGNGEKVRNAMRKIRFFVCPVCGEVTATTGAGAVSCCGRRLESLAEQKAEEKQKLQVEELDGEWYVSGQHPMVKEHYVSFVALVSGGELHLVRQYPEWNLQVHLPSRGHGRLFWHDTREGLFYQII